MAERAEEITQALSTQERHKSALCTFTLRHHAGCPLPMLRKLLAASYSEMKAGRTGADLQLALNYAGDIRSAEQTVGKSNGWHPHLHSIWFSELPILKEHWTPALADRWATCVRNAYNRTETAITNWRAGRVRRAWREGDPEQSAKQKARKLWRQAQPEYEVDHPMGGPPLKLGQIEIAIEFEKAGRLLGKHYAKPGRSLVEAADLAWEDFRKLGGLARILPDCSEGGAGVDVEPLTTTEQAAHYLAKLGLELASFAGEANADHLSTWQLARVAATGDAWAIWQWQIHSSAMLGARQLTWSRGLRQRLGMHEERADAEIAAEEARPGDSECLIGIISAEDWDQQVKERRQGLIADLHLAYDAGKLDQVWYVQAAINKQHREPRSADPPLQPARPTWWERNGARIDAERRGKARAQFAADLAAERKAADLWALIPLDSLSDMWQT